MSNAAKHRKKAAEFEQLKQIDRAIASYVRAIEESEADGEDVDVALLNKVGDLALRQGRVPDAVTYYERAVEHYATAGLFNNAIALCNKILRNAPGRSNVYFTLGRICARKGLRGDATRNFLEYASRMQQEGRVEEAMRALGEVVDLMPELTEVRRLVDEHAVRAGVELPRRRTPLVTEAVAVPAAPRFAGDKSSNLVFLEVDYSAASARLTPPIAPRAQGSTAPALAIDAPARPPAKTPPVALPFIDLDEPPVVARNASPPLSGIEVLADDRAAAVTPPAAIEDLSAGAPPASPVGSPPESTSALLADPADDDPTRGSFHDLPMLDFLDSAASVDPGTVDDIADTESELPLLEVPMLDWSGEDDAALVTLEPLEFVDPERSSGAFESLQLDHIEPAPAENRQEPTHESFAQPPVELTDEGTPPDLIVDDLTAIDDGRRDVVPDLPMVTQSEPVAALSALPEYEPEPRADNEPAPERPSPDVQTPVHVPPVTDLLTDAPMDAATPVEAPNVGRPDTRTRTPLASSPIPAIEAAIAAGAEAAAREAAARPAVRRPPFRLDPHDFILPGELPPLLVDDVLVDAGLRRARESVASPPTPLAAVAFVTPVGTPRFVQRLEMPGSIGHGDAADAMEDDGDAIQEEGHEAAPIERVEQPNDVAALGAVDEPTEVPDAFADVVSDEGRDGVADSATEVANERDVVRMTPSLPIAAVAAEANAVAEARRDELRAAVAASPQDWALRRRLAEALFEAGHRDAALAELEGSLQGFVQAGQIADAADVSEMLVGVSPERVSYHQKRVELAVRLNDQQRLRFAYLDLADALVRSGEESRAQAVYVRVLEIDPLDDRARAALGSAAPPPPPPKPTADETGFVNLADWLREDEGPASTRMRMREPAVSGDEQADFAALLRHFKDGVSRSLGDEDFESRYDLGVAFKEMGLLDDAIGEFQKALRSKTHRLPAYEALGQCFVEQGRYQVAATVLSRALHEPGLNDEQRVGVLYLLAYSCEALQRWGEARSYFQRVYATDINFRDVAARLAALEQVAS